MLAARGDRRAVVPAAARQVAWSRSNARAGGPGGHGPSATSSVSGADYADSAAAGPGGQEPLATRIIASTSPRALCAGRAARGATAARCCANNARSETGEGHGPRTPPRRPPPRRFAPGREGQTAARACGHRRPRLRLSKRQGARLLHGASPSPAAWRLAVLKCCARARRAGAAAGLLSGRALGWCGYRDSSSGSGSARALARPHIKNDSGTSDTAWHDWFPAGCCGGGNGFPRAFAAPQWRPAHASKDRWRGSRGGPPAA
jgi:hypothetical protein